MNGPLSNGLIQPAMITSTIQATLYASRGTDRLLLASPTRANAQQCMALRMNWTCTETFREPNPGKRDLSGPPSVCRLYIRATPTPSDGPSQSNGEQSHGILFPLPIPNGYFNAVVPTLCSIDHRIYHDSIVVWWIGQRDP